MENSALEKQYTIIPNPDFIYRKKIEEAVRDNNGYCPCSPIQNEDTICMCKAFRDQEHSGMCHCGRYFKVLKAPKVCLCGSTRFKDKFFEVARTFTLKGCIVTMPMVFMHSDNESEDEIDKEYLDEIHKAKIAEADLVYIINCDNYIGQSTRSEINWALELGKKIEYLES